MGKKYLITTYGCQANTADSERISGLLEALGMVETKVFEETDLILVNSCSVRQSSEDKVYGLANRVQKLRAKSPELKVILTGCLVRGAAYINISQGCDNFCTFCVVPYARGREVSRSEADILREINHALSRGFKEVVLLGQNVNSWGLTPEDKLLSRKRLGRLPFADLLRKVHDLDGVKKIKFLTSNPFDFSSDLVEALKMPKIDRYLHLPVQSGDNEILQKMGRRHRREDYLELVSEIRRAVPEIELGTDIIVGFPTETEAQFANTVKLVEEVGFNVIFAAIYSPRPGTSSARRYVDDIPLKEKRRRYAYISQILRRSKLK